MCTAISYRSGGHFFGRTLDLDCSYGEQITVTPRRYPFMLRHMPTMERHYALIGMTTAHAQQPLYYDGVNEKGLCMAGLNFPHSARYLPPAEGAENVASFELIPWVLGQCATVAEARQRLARVRLADTPYSAALCPAPLHWIVADSRESMVLEPLADGLHMYDDPAAVLTNEPPFPDQMIRLTEYAGLTRKPPENLFAPALPLPPYSRGMGAMGLPGDLSSGSRFVRAAFHLHNADAGRDAADSIRQFFHILGTVEHPRGSVQLPDGRYQITVYTACCHADRGVYYVTTYDNPHITGVAMHREDLDGTRPVSYPLPGAEAIELLH